MSGLDQDQIGELAGRDCAELAGKAQGCRPAFGCGGEDCFRLWPFGEIGFGAAWQHHRQAHIGENVSAAAGVGRIIADREAQAAILAGAEIQHATAEHEVARRVVADGDVVARQSFHLVGCEPHAVGASQPAFEQAFARHRGYQAAGIEPVQRLLRTGFEQMGVDRDIMSVSQIPP